MAFFPLVFSWFENLKGLFILSIRFGSENGTRSLFGIQWEFNTETKERIITLHYLWNWNQAWYKKEGEVEVKAEKVE